MIDYTPVDPRRLAIVRTIDGALDLSIGELIEPPDPLPDSFVEELLAVLAEPVDPDGPNGCFH